MCVQKVRTMSFKFANAYGTICTLSSYILRVAAAICSWIVCVCPRVYMYVYIDMYIFFSVFKVCVCVSAKISAPMTCSS